jgi:protein associated with RNAse G/E
LQKEKEINDTEIANAYYYQAGIRNFALTTNYIFVFSEESEVPLSINEKEFMKYYKISENINGICHKVIKDLRNFRKNKKSKFKPIILEAVYNRNNNINTIVEHLKCLKLGVNL